MAETVACGPKFYEWLIHTDANLEDANLGPAFARAIDRWKDGDNATLGKVDELCVRVGLHLSQVPEEIWMDRPPRKKFRCSTPETRSEAIARVLAGESNREVAESIGCTPRAVANWVHAARLIEGR